MAQSVVLVAVLQECCTYSFSRNPCPDHEIYCTGPRPASVQICSVLFVGQCGTRYACLVSMRHDLMCDSLQSITMDPMLYLRPPQHAYWCTLFRSWLSTTIIFMYEDHALNLVVNQVTHTLLLLRLMALYSDDVDSVTKYLSNVKGQHLTVCLSVNAIVSECHRPTLLYTSTLVQA